jgi:hypothetical protein
MPEAEADRRIDKAAPDAIAKDLRVRTPPKDFLAGAIYDGDRTSGNEEPGISHPQQERKDRGEPDGRRNHQEHGFANSERSRCSSEQGAEVRSPEQREWQQETPDDPVKQKAYREPTSLTEGELRGLEHGKRGQQREGRREPKREFTKLGSRAEQSHGMSV